MLVAGKWRTKMTILLGVPEFARRHTLARTRLRTRNWAN